MAFQQISDFFDLSPAKDVRFDVDRTLAFTKANGTSSDISLISQDNDVILPFVKTNGTASNIKTRLN